MQRGSVPEDGKGIAADAVAGRLDHRKSDGGREGRVHGVAAV
jgi:hypothetical protein